MYTRFIEFIVIMGGTFSAVVCFMITVIPNGDYTLTTTPTITAGTQDGQYIIVFNEDPTNTITLQDKKYPQLLKEIPDSPKRLYYKGEWNDDIFTNCLAVVGTRQMTAYGRRITEQLVSEIAAAGITIVSGFMYGVDATAHKAALRVGGRTIAVMPCGIDLIHPEHQVDLYNEILSPYEKSSKEGETNGLIISEWEGTFAPVLWSYPKRNRIVAGLSKATLVIEAGEKSGSFITANFARKYKRKLFAVPGPITSSVSLGTARLLQEGAAVVITAQDVLEYYQTQSPLPLKKRSKSSKDNGIEHKILDYLDREALEIDELARVLHIPVAQIGTTLSLMQLQGLVLQEEGRYYAA